VSSFNAFFTSEKHVWYSMFGYKSGMKNKQPSIMNNHPPVDRLYAYGFQGTDKYPLAHMYIICRWLDLLRRYRTAALYKLPCSGNRIADQINTRPLKNMMSWPTLIWN